MIEAPMGDARFFARSSPHALRDIAIAAEGTAPEIEQDIRGRRATAIGRTRIRSVFSTIGVTSSRSSRPWRARSSCTRRCGTVFRLARSLSSRLATYEGWARVAALFHPIAPPCPGIHPSAVVDKRSAGGRFGGNRPLRRDRGSGGDRRRCRIGQFASIGKGVYDRPRLSDRRARQPQPRSAGVARLHLSRRKDRSGRLQLRHHKTGFLSIPQLGRVIVEDDVEVGANTTIDRGSTRDTTIGAGTRIDNSYRSATMFSSDAAASLWRRSELRDRRSSRTSFRSAARLQWRGICVSAEAARSARRQASSRMHPRVRFCLEALHSRGQSSFDRSPR